MQIAIGYRQNATPCAIIVIGQKNHFDKLIKKRKEVQKEYG
jgi:hypothetical protein